MGCSLVRGYHELLLQPEGGYGRLLRNVDLLILTYTSQDCNFDIYARYDTKSYLRDWVLLNRNHLIVFRISHDCGIQCLKGKSVPLQA